MDRRDTGAAKIMLELSAKQGNKTAATFLAANFSAETTSSSDSVEAAVADHAASASASASASLTDNFAQAHRMEPSKIRRISTTAAVTRAAYTNTSAPEAATAASGAGARAVSLLPSALRRLLFTAAEENVLTSTHIPPPAPTQLSDVHSNVGKVLVVGIATRGVNAAAAGVGTSVAETVGVAAPAASVHDSAGMHSRTSKELFYHRCFEIARDLGPVKLSKVPAAFKERYGEMLDYKALGFRKLASAIKSIDGIVVAGESSNVTMALPPSSTGSASASIPLSYGTHSNVSCDIRSDSSSNSGSGGGSGGGGCGGGGGGSVAEECSSGAATAPTRFLPLVPSEAATKAAAAAATGAAMLAAIPEWQLVARCAQANFVLESLTPPEPLEVGATPLISTPPVPATAEDNHGEGIGDGAGNAGGSTSSSSSSRATALPRVGAAAVAIQAALERAAARELALIRTSMVTQPQYFAIPFSVVHDGGAIVVVDKPFDLQISHGTNQRPRFQEELTVADLTRRVLGGSRRMYSRCHNLDFATSGLLVLAATKEALRAGMQAFAEEGVVEKEYLAIVIGWPTWEMRKIDVRIAADSTHPFRMRADAPPPPPEESPDNNVVDPDIAERWGPSRLPPAPRWARDSRAAKPRACFTKATVLRKGYNSLGGPLNGMKVTLMRLQPSTGRRHQLRVHMAYMGHPILGDVTYAGDITTHRLCLHAHKIKFHAAAGEVGGSIPGAKLLPTHTITSTPPFASFIHSRRIVEL